MSTRESQGKVTTPYLEVKGLKKRFALKPILRGVDLALERGERMALLGANGAGKTTLLRILAGLTRPAEGSICLAGLDGIRDTQQMRHLIGFVAHQPYLYDDLTVIENLFFFARMYTVKNASTRALELLRRVEMEKYSHERAGTLSRGQIQRVSMVRALLHSPQLLLLDEPETGLDQAGEALVDALLAEYTAQGGTMLFTTHQLERALQLSDSIAILGKGRIAYRDVTARLALEEVRRTYQAILN